MKGYNLTHQARRAEARYEASRQGKSIIGLDDGLSAHFGASRQDGSNFRTNTVTLSEFQDSGASTNTLGLSAVWACVNLLAGTIASLPLMVYRTEGDVRRADPRHPLYRLLHDSPNYDQTAVDFWEFMQAALELQGNAYAEKEVGAGGRIISLTPIRPDLVSVRRRADGELEYSWTVDSVRNVATSERILHVRGFGGGPLGGASTLSVCRRTFGAASSVESASSAMFRNGVRPSGVLSVDVPLDRGQRQETEGYLQEKFVGAMNEGRPMLLDRGMKWEQLTIDPGDAQMLESRRFSVEEICRVFGIPPHMIGHTENSTSWGTGLEQQTLGFQKFTLRRRLKRIEQALEKQLLTPADRAAGVTIEFNLEGLLRGDSKARAEYYKAALGNTQEPGWMIRNEIRRIENLPPVEGWDDPIPLITQGKPEDDSGGAPPALPAA